MKLQAFRNVFSHCSSPIIRLWHSRAYTFRDIHSLYSYLDHSTAYPPYGPACNTNKKAARTLRVQRKPQAWMVAQNRAYTSSWAVSVSGLVPYAWSIHKPYPFVRILLRLQPVLGRPRSVKTDLGVKLTPLSGKCRLSPQLSYQSRVWKIVFPHCHSTGGWWSGRSLKIASQYPDKNS